MISGQLQLRDTLNYILPGSLFIGLVCLVTYNFTGINLLDLITDKVILFLLLITTTYIIGFFLRTGYSKYIKTKEQKGKSRISRIATKIFLGKTRTKNEKVEYYKMWEHEIIHKFILRGILNNKENNVRSTTDLFFLAQSYIKNYASPASLYQIERYHISFNLAFKLCTVFILGQVISVFMLIFKLFEIGELNWSIIIVTLSVSFFSLRYSWKMFESTIDSHAINVWRVFLIADKKE